MCTYICLSVFHCSSCVCRTRSLPLSPSISLSRSVSVCLSVSLSLCLSLSFITVQIIYSYLSYSFCTHPAFKRLALNGSLPLHVLIIFRLSSPLFSSTLLHSVPTSSDRKPSITFF